MQRARALRTRTRPVTSTTAGASSRRFRILEDPTVSGVAITHGTATLEETAYFLHLTVPTERTIVLVGAQRPPTALGSDSQQNLLGAIRVAAAPQSVGRGVFVAMDNVILGAREVTKSSNHSLHTFQPRDHGALGDIDPYGRVWYDRRLDLRHTTSSRIDPLDVLRHHSASRLEKCGPKCGQNHFRRIRGEPRSLGNTGIAAPRKWTRRRESNPQRHRV
ncbi:asparaginase domain-containing protein [Microbacterium sp. zg.B48]|uniref:asparaginase domain-containing protein n=1 Tax=Microbacterium sp. zg.B48 TaxID=2969408 RepID=UPI0035A98DC3